MPENFTLQEASGLIRTELMGDSDAQLHHNLNSQPIYALGECSLESGCRHLIRPTVEMPSLPEGTPVGEVGATSDMTLAAFWPDEGAPDFDTNSKVMELQQRVRGLEGQVMISNRGQELLAHRLSEEIRLKDALMVTLNITRDEIEQLIQRYDGRMREQAHQFDLAFATLQEERRLRDQQFEETVRIGSERYRLLMQQLGGQAD